MSSKNNILKFLKDFGLEYKMINEDIIIKKGQIKGKFKLIELNSINNAVLNNLLFNNGKIFACINSILDSSQALLLKKLQVYFIDSGGNFFINIDDIYIYNYQKSTKKSYTASGPSPLKSAGVKYAYHVLQNPELLYETLESISAVADISRGSAANLKVLFSKTYIDDFEELDKGKLISDFSESFNNLTKQSITLGEYYCENLNTLLDDKRVKISGQHAVKMLTKNHNIIPRHAQIYINEEDLGSLVLDYNIEKYSKLVNVMIYKDILNIKEKFVPLFLAYTDLCGSKDPRDNELAAEVLNDLKQ